MAVGKHVPVRVRNGEDHVRGPRPSSRCVPVGLSSLDGPVEVLKGS